jgi:hypothetical protein
VHMRHVLCRLCIEKEYDKFYMWQARSQAYLIVKNSPDRFLARSCYNKLPLWVEPCWEVERNVYI